MVWVEIGGSDGGIFLALPLSQLGGALTTAGLTYLMYSGIGLVLPLLARCLFFLLVLLVLAIFQFPSALVLFTLGLHVSHSAFRHLLCISDSSALVLTCSCLHHLLSHSALHFMEFVCDADLHVECAPLAFIVGDSSEKKYSMSERK